MDVAVVGQDPWFGGGAARQTAAFCEGVRALGRDPVLFYVSRERAVSPLRPFAALRSPGVRDEGAYRSLLPELDSLNQLAAVRLAPRLRTSRSLWVVATAAHYGIAATRTGRPYACWVGTSLRDEWRGRVAGGLPRSRRLAVRVNAPVLTRIERAVLRGAAAVYATSPASRRSVATAADVPEHSVRLLPIPVDVATLRPEPDEHWLERLDAPVIAFVGRADDPRKNMPLLLEAFARLRDRVPRARLRLVGSAPEAAVLPAGVEAVGAVGSVADELRAASVFVLPSWQEGFGIVVAEALACGVPAVVTPCGGPEDLVRASGGGVVLEGFDADELATTLTGLLADPDRLRAMRHGGREHVEREHSPTRFRHLLSAAFEELDGMWPDGPRPGAAPGHV